MMGYLTAPPRNIHERRQMLSREIRCGIGDEAQDRAIDIVYGLLDEIATFERTVSHLKFLVERLEEKNEKTHHLEKRVENLTYELKSVSEANSLMTTLIDKLEIALGQLKNPLSDEEIFEIARYWSNTTFAANASRFLSDFARALHEKKISQIDTGGLTSLH